MGIKLQVGLSGISGHRLSQTITIQRTRHCLHHCHPHGRHASGVSACSIRAAGDKALGVHSRPPAFLFHSLRTLAPKCHLSPSYSDTRFALSSSSAHTRVHARGRVVSSNPLARLPRLRCAYRMRTAHDVSYAHASRAHHTQASHRSPHACAEPLHWQRTAGPNSVGLRAASRIYHLPTKTWTRTLTPSCPPRRIGTHSPGMQGGLAWHGVAWWRRSLRVFGLGDMQV